MSALILRWLTVLSAASLPGLLPAASFYPVRLEDPQGVYLTPDRFPVRGDGVADDSQGLQQAIDQVATNNQAGMLFVPPGTYRLARTVYVWPGVRLIGYGPTRPCLVLMENTPGFQEGEGKYLLFFSGGSAAMCRSSPGSRTGANPYRVPGHAMLWSASPAASISGIRGPLVRSRPRWLPDR